MLVCIRFNLLKKKNYAYTLQYPEYVREQISSAHQFPRPGHEFYSSTYNLGLGDHPNFLQTQQARDHDFTPSPKQDFSTLSPTTLLQINSYINNLLLHLEYIMLNFKREYCKPCKSLRLLPNMFTLTPNLFQGQKPKWDNSQ